MVFAGQPTSFRLLRIASVWYSQGSRLSYCFGLLLDGLRRAADFLWIASDCFWMDYTGNDRDILSFSAKAGVEPRIYRTKNKCCGSHIGVILRVRSGSG